MKKTYLLVDDDLGIIDTTEKETQEDAQIHFTNKGHTVGEIILEDEFTNHVKDIKYVD